MNSFFYAIDKAKTISPKDASPRTMTSTSLVVRSAWHATAPYTTATLNLASQRSEG
jgi:hypothetical protein